VYSSRTVYQNNANLPMRLGSSDMMRLRNSAVLFLRFLKEQARSIGLASQVVECVEGKPILILTWTGTCTTRGHFQLVVEAGSLLAILNLVFPYCHFFGDADPDFYGWILVRWFRPYPFPDPYSTLIQEVLFL
jgi:hypothetical protein